MKKEEAKELAIQKTNLIRKVRKWRNKGKLSSNVKQ